MARPRLGPWLGIIDQILDGEEAQPKKQRHAARRICDRLEEAYAFSGGYTIVKDYVRGARLRPREVFVPLSYSPGGAQADFGEALVVIGGVEQKGQESLWAIGTAIGSPSDARKLLEQHISLDAVLAQKKWIEVNVAIEGSLPTLSLDGGRIVQVINSLISNAVKFSPPGTLVSVSASAEAGWVRIAVGDQGEGIPEAERGKLFQPFGKTSVRATSGESSTGLGLAIVRKIVEEHCGRIWVESEVGVGSVFVSTLPS